MVHTTLQQVHSNSYDVPLNTIQWVMGNDHQGNKVVSALEHHNLLRSYNSLLENCNFNRQGEICCNNQKMFYYKMCTVFIRIEARVLISYKQLFTRRLMSPFCILYRRLFTLEWWTRMFIQAQASIWALLLFG